jgi:hypothetical protein
MGWSLKFQAPALSNRRWKGRAEVMENRDMLALEWWEAGALKIVSIVLGRPSALGAGFGLSGRRLSCPTNFAIREIRSA